MVIETLLLLAVLALFHTTNSDAGSTHASAMTSVAIELAIAGLAAVALLQRLRAGDDGGSSTRPPRWSRDRRAAALCFAVAALVGPLLFTMPIPRSRFLAVWTLWVAIDALAVAASASACLRRRSPGILALLALSSANALVPLAWPVVLVLAKNGC